jgi:hypothetical protein
MGSLTTQPLVAADHRSAGRRVALRDGRRDFCVGKQFPENAKVELPTALERAEIARDFKAQLAPSPDSRPPPFAAR